MRQRTPKRATRAALLREYVCAECGGRLVELYDLDAGYRIVCAQHPEAQRVHQATYERRRSRAVNDYAEAAQNYPELDARPKLTPEEIERGVKLLWPD